MGDFSLYGGSQVFESFGASGSDGTGVAAGSINAKGSWVQLIASTSWDAIAIIIQFQLYNGVEDFLVDIGVGASGSEEVIIPNFLYSGVTGQKPQATSFPIHVASGSRIAARTQCSQASLTIFMCGILTAPTLDTYEPLGRVTDYGTATGDSGGTSVDPGATVNTKGAWSQLVASSANPMRKMIITLGNQDNEARTASNMLIDISVGGAGSEEIIVPDIAARTDGQIGPPVELDVALPSGVRIAARSACSITDATDRLVDVAVYGVD